MLKGNEVEEWPVTFSRERMIRMINDGPAAVATNVENYLRRKEWDTGCSTNQEYGSYNDSCTTLYRSPLQIPALSIAEVFVPVSF